jgi:hypothetical protein
MSRINIKKLVDTIKEEEATGSQMGAGYMTALYSFRAHLRGRLHMSRILIEQHTFYAYQPGIRYSRALQLDRLTTLEQRPHGRVIEWTMDLQEKLIQHYGLWEKFALAEVVIAGEVGIEPVLPLFSHAGN